MKASELRIGNSIMQDDDFVFVTWWRLELMVNNKLEYKPIPLTEEWLFKFGFDKDKNGLFKLFNESEVPILFNKDLNGWTCDGINFSVNGTQYVHQLQNLYHALTGEELTIKDEVY